MKEIVLNTVYKTKNYRKYTALVDDEDFEKVNQLNWYVYKKRHTFYAMTKINGKLIFLHNFIMGIIGIDHEDHDGLNNQRYNLRRVTQSQNMMNKRKTRGSSQYKGVSWHRRFNKWEAQIICNYRKIWLGYFTSEPEAAQAYNEAAKIHHGPYAKLNELLLNKKTPG